MSGTRLKSNDGVSGSERISQNRSLLVQSGETDDVDLAPGREKVEKPTAKPWAHFLAGGLGGMTAATLTSPLDVLKTRLQSDFYQAQLQQLRASHPRPPTTSSISSITRSAAVHFGETIQMLRSIHVHEGWRALFKGLGPNLTGVVPARAINFYVYGNGKRMLNEYFNYDPNESPVAIHLGAAAIAGIATGTATNPIWLVKTRMQLDKNASQQGRKGRQYVNSLDCIRQTVRHEGIQGLYRGLSASYLGVSESALQWVLYEQMKRALAQREARLAADPTHVAGWVDDAVSWGGKLVAAGSAKLVAAVVTYPHEVVRTRLRQAPTVPVSGGGKVEMKYSGLAQCFKVIWKEEGMAGMYGGLTPHLLRVVPSAAIMFGM
ncbi:hypothetical protein FQN49_005349 [Arthroderma sp. PD_2]|nr:hypothetical protein FQN49_005349 [Arthroderma sp. PD_2]